MLQSRDSERQGHVILSVALSQSRINAPNATFSHSLAHCVPIQQSNSFNQLINESP